MLIRTKFEGYSKDGVRLYPCDGDDGGGATTVQSSEPPEWVKGYAKDTLGRASALTDINANPYKAYGGDRTAAFGDLQTTAQKSALGMQPAAQLGDATSLTTSAANRGLNTNYSPSYFSNQFQAPQQFQPELFSYMGVNAPELQQFRMGPAERVFGGNYNTPQMAALQEMGPFERVSPQSTYTAPEMDTAQTGFRPDLRTFQMGPVADVRASRYGTPEMRAAQTGFRPDLQQFQMGPAERASTQSFTQPGSAEAYMSPFMQSVVDKQIREAERQSGLAAKQQRAQAIQRGAFGGAGTAISEAAAARDLAELKSDIYGTGQQAAFQNAQQQFNAEQQARMQAQLANQQAGLTVGGQNLSAALGVQQLGTQTGLQSALANLSNRQQANVQNQAAQLQTQGLNAQQAMQAALANQQAGLTVGQQNLASQQATQQLGTQTGLQAALANLSAEQQANVQNQAARLQTQGLNAQQAMQAALANQQAGLTTGQQNLAARLTRDQQNLAAQLQTQGLTAQQAMQAALANQQAGLTVGQQNLAAQLGVQQLGSGQNMQAQLAEQQAYQDMLRQREASRQFGYGQQMNAAQQRAQYGQAANQLMEQSRQYGAGLNMQGIQAALQGAGMLGNLGQTQFGQEKDIIGLQSQLGAQEQAQRQQKLTQDYQDFLAQERYPYQQLEFMSNILRGSPMGTMSTMYQQQAAPSTASQLGSIGLGAYGLSRMFKEGGAVGGYADGGDVDSEDNVAEIVDSLSDEQLPQSLAAAQARGDAEQVIALQNEMASRQRLRAAEQRSLNGGLGGAFDTLPRETQDQVLSAAGGGIVALSGGGRPSSASASDDDDDQDSFLEMLSGTPGNPATYESLSKLYPQLLQRIAKMERPTGMSAKEAEAFEKKYIAEETAAGGESPYAKMRQSIAEMQDSRGKNLEQSKGYAALMAAGAMGNTPGSFMRGLSAAMSQGAPILMSAQQADKAEARAIANMELNLSDAERKERMGLRRDARAARAQADKDRIEAGKYQIEREKMLASLTSQGMRHTKPVAAKGSSGPKEFEFGTQALLAKVKKEHPNLSPDEQKAMAFQMYQQGKSAGLEGANIRAETARDQITQRVNALVTEGMQGFDYTREGIQARKLARQGDTEGAAKVRKEYEANLRRTAEADIGRSGNQRVSFDSQGNQIR